MKEEKEKDIPKTSATSAVTTDLPATKEGEEEPFVETNALVASGLGLVKVMGIDQRYVGMPPALDEFNPVAEGELKLSSQNTTFIPLWEVPFSQSIQIKDPTTGEFYFPADNVANWESCEHNGVKLVPPLPEAPPPGGGNGGAVAPSERSFAGTGTLDLTVDALKDTGSVTTVAMEDSSAAPSYSVPNVTTLHSSDETTVWPTGVNVLVTSNWADDPVADAAARGGKKDDAAAESKAKDKEKADKDAKEKADKDAKDKARR